MRDQALWTWHLITGSVVLVLLGVHMTIMHLDVVVGYMNPAGGHPVDWANVAARAKGVGMAISYVLLLGAALFHGLYGFRNILFELNPALSVRRLVNVVFVVGGLGLFGYGAWAAVVALQHAGVGIQPTAGL